MYTTPASPARTQSDAGSPSKKGFSLLSPFRKMQRAESPTSSTAGSEAGTPRSHLFPSFTSSQRKRDVIKKLEEDISLLNLQVHQQEVQLGRLQQQAQQSEAAKLDAQERLNMQMFKSNLLADMLVVRLLELGADGLMRQPIAASGNNTTAAAVQQQQQQQLLADEPQQTASSPASASVAQHLIVQESSFDDE